MTDAAPALTKRDPAPHVEPDYKSMVIMYCHDEGTFSQGYVAHELAEVWTVADCLEMRDEIVRLRRLCGKDITSAL